MSGAEAAAFVGLVDACISLTGKIISIGQAAKDAHGLPDKLGDYFKQLPTVKALFEKAKQNKDNGARKNAEPTLDDCEEALRDLEALFRKICPKDDTNHLKRVWKGAKAEVLGRNSKLQELWKKVEGYLNTLEKQEIFTIGDSLSGLKKALELLAEEDSGKYTHHGSGNQIITEEGGITNTQGGGSNNTFSQYNSGRDIHVATHNYHVPIEDPLNHRCLQSLAFPNMEKRDDITAKATGTCEWILTHQTYLAWIQHGGVLWIEGRPGSGKSTIMESIRSTAAKEPSEFAFIASFFFHRRGDALQHSSLGLFRSLLHQILSHDRALLSAFMLDVQFEQRCEQKGAPGVKWQWTESELRSYLVRYVQRFTEKNALCLHIDALDEAGETVAGELMGYLRDLASPRLRICVSCRPWPDIISDSQWDYCVHIELQNTEDIQACVRSLLRNYVNDANETDMAEIEDRITIRSCGVFQWAVLVTRRVVSLRHHEDFGKDFALDAIGKIPQDLSNLYQSMFAHLRELMNEKDRVQALQIMRWITFAESPLSLEELRYAVAFDTDDQDTQFRGIRDREHSVHWCESDELMEKRVLRLSSGLVRVVKDKSDEKMGLKTQLTLDLARALQRDQNLEGEDRPRLQFDHESVRDYMIDNGIQFLEMSDRSVSKKGVVGRAHHRLLMSCLRYIRDAAVEDQKSSPEESLTAYNDTVHGSANFPFAVYASLCCDYHMRAADAQGVSLSNVIRFTHWPSNAIWEKMLLIRDYGLDYQESASQRNIYKRTTLQHFAAEHGLRSLMEAIIPLCKERSLLATISASMGTMISRSRGYLRTRYRHGEESINASHSHGKESINASDSVWNSPLHLAAYSGHENIVKLLISTKSVLVDLTNEEGETALVCASIQGHVQVVKLLAAKANFNVCSQHEGTALYKAARRGHFEVVQSLLAVNAFVNAPASVAHKRAALETAAKHGHLKIVERLLAAKADPNALPSSNGDLSALQAAALGGHLPIVERLLIAGADVNAAYCWGSETALHFAIRANHHEIVKRLLDNGANVHMTDKWHSQTALHLAAYGGNFRIVEALVSAGSNLSSRDKENRTPLQVAEEQQSSREEDAECEWSAVIEYLNYRQSGQTSSTFASFDTYCNMYEYVPGVRADAAWDSE